MTVQRIRLRSRRGLSYTRRGTGPVVLLLHGWCLSGETWRYQEYLLAEGHTVVVPDLAGFGRSADLGGQISAARHVDDLADLVQELGVAPVHVVGFAYGAMVAMRWSRRRPADLAAIVLVGVPSAAEAPYDRMPRAMLRDWPSFAVRSAAGICRPGTSPATLDWLARLYMNTPMHAAMAGVAELGRWEPLDDAPAVPHPALVLHGADDKVVPVDIGRAVAAALPQGSFVLVDAAAHLVPVDAAAALTDEVAAFIGRHDATTAPG